MAQRVQHKRSLQLSGGEALAPSASQLTVGEIAINYASGHEKIFTLNSDNQVVAFSSDGQILDIVQELSASMIDDEYVISASLNDLNERMLSATSVINSLSAVVEENEYVTDDAINNLNGKIASLSGGVRSDLLELSGTVDENELVFATAINDLNDRVVSLSGNSISGVMMNGSAVTVTNGVIDLGNIMGENEGLVISEALTDLNIRTNESLIRTNKSLTGVTVNGSAVTVTNKVANIPNMMGESEELVISEALTNLNTRVETIENIKIAMNGSAVTVTNGVIDIGNVMTDLNDEVIAAALNDLNDRIGDIESVLATI